MKKIAVITNFNISEKAVAALSVADKLNELGCEVYVASFNRERINRNSGGVKRDYLNYVPLDKLFSIAELIIPLGGDGTILEVARRAVPAGKPMLGFNLGRVGYMAELEINELDRLDDVVNEKFELEERMLLKVELLDKNNKSKLVSFALNDAVISNGSVARIVDLVLYENGVEVSSYRADGMIVATPTGSTAYSMSAGGAIVDSRVSCICVTPICPHSLVSRPFIFPDTAEIEVKNICQREKVLFLTLDGKSNYEIAYGDVVKVTKLNLYAKLVRLKDNDFYNRLRTKMISN
jgi:NAD+ kinase